MKTMGRKLLVIDRYPSVYRYLRRRFSDQGYDIAGLPEPEHAQAMVAALSPDIVVVATDLLTGKDAALIRQIRRVASVPILGLLPGSRAEDAIHALDAGVDDCIAQPFSLEELAARLRNMLTRELVRHGLMPGVVSDLLRIDFVTRRIWRNRREIVLSEVEFRLLQLLVTATGQWLHRRSCVSEFLEQTAAIRLAACVAWSGRCVTRSRRIPTGRCIFKPSGGWDTGFPPV